MSITANVLYRDSFYFFRNKLGSILIIVLLTAFISVSLNHFLGNDTEMLKILGTIKGDFATSTSLSIQEFINQITPEQQIILLQASAAATFSALVGKALLVSGVLTLLRLVSQGQCPSMLSVIGASIPVLPRLMIMLFICSLLIQLGIRLLVVPGVIMALAFSLSSVIMTTDQKGILASIKSSYKMAFDNVRIIAPAMIIWLVAKLLILLIFSYLPSFVPNITNLVFTTLSNLISTLLLIYLFRLYMLLRS
ncbi:hypothetical protein SCc_381 [Serratia symbiotica str. 'Cinara cedri']|uniref:UPF0259 membrane protein n=1 Tax=Serratia symbiotica TaxID=138074 RepID=B4YQR8_9GAMM|nr:hypothetical protein [Serratia symbiotica]AEW44533.1 hypothetical protein SCc_381 [Serratia symbiotica str. 'Cinara cedri']